MDAAGLRPAQTYLNRFPHELSGGQRQRLAIAASLVLEPRFIVADEPVSMLDVSVRAGIVRLLASLRDERGLAFLFITHDLALAWLIADRIAIMYLGRIVEMGKADDVIDNPAHPYTRALIAAVPEPSTGKVNVIKKLPISGEIPSPTNIPPGCRFHTRCPYAIKECAEGPEPELMDMGGSHWQACRRWRDI